MRNIIFEKVGDVHSIYPYICIYFEGDREAFMEIAVSDAKELQFTIYSRAENILIEASQWSEILKEAYIFLPKALANEEAI